MLARTRREGRFKTSKDLQAGFFTSQLTPPLPPTFAHTAIHHT